MNKRLSTRPASLSGLRSYMHAGRFGILLVLCLLASACSTTVKDEPKKTVSVSQQDKATRKEKLPVDWSDQEQMRKAILQWELRGRLGVQTADNGGMMDIIWKQTANEFSIRLIAPLGAGSTLIQGVNDFATIRYPDGSRRDIEDVNQVFKQALDVDLPVSALKDWVRGLPASDMAIQKRTWNELGLIERLQQSGWKVEMKEYTGTDIQMPHAIYLSHRDKEDIDIRLLLKQWLIDD